MNEPIVVPCEGSGGPTHQTKNLTSDLSGTCAMCGERVVLSNGVACRHSRRDILAMIDYSRRDFLAMIDRGDFDL